MHGISNGIVLNRRISFEVHYYFLVMEKMSDSIDIRDKLCTWFVGQTGLYEDMCDFMRSKNTVRQTSMYLAVDVVTARRFIAMLYMHREQNVIFSDNPIDNVLKRLCTGLVQRLERREPVENLRQATNRIKPIFEAWKTRDTTVLVQYLTEEAVKQSVEKSDQLGTTMDILEAISDKDTVNTIKKRCNLAVASVDRLETRVASEITTTMEKAFWEYAKSRVREGELDALYDVLTHASQAVTALLSASKRAQDEFDDRFNIPWIKQRGDSGELTREDIGNLTVYFAEKVAAMQAPVDDVTVQPWLVSVRVRANIPDTVVDFLPDVVFIVRDGIHHLRLVSKRIEKLCDDKK